ncbi:hypothetical protein [Caulobacter sp. 17J65-9]|uniref:hypothetical protein n=1 Tax=Caulobacter sp. 17J65-9 TaxID=2709382 RepID=UPI0013CAF814|nr:hypothetical protein [Caulobacter sp. 17J65-9]NEX92857.1 hypothetical protein [Caulobacter sp. 17J65-9]
MALAVHALAISGMLLTIKRPSGSTEEAISVELVTWPQTRSSAREPEPSGRGPRLHRSEASHDGSAPEAAGAPDGPASVQPDVAAGPEPFRLRQRRVFCDQLTDGGLARGPAACVERWASSRAYPELAGVPGELRLRWDAEVRRRDAPMGKTIVPCDRDMAGSNLGLGCLPSSD